MIGLIIITIIIIIIIIIEFLQRDTVVTSEALSADQCSD